VARRGHGEGSIYKGPEGRWRAVVDLGQMGGKRQRKYLSGKTRREVQLKLTAALRDHQQGLPLAPERQTLEHFLTRWLEDTARPSVRPRVFIRYRELLTLHVIPVLGKRPLVKLTPQELNTLHGQKVAAGLSPQTVTHLHRVLHRALRDAVRWNLTPRNVCDLVDPPRVPRRREQWLDVDQARQLLAAAAGDPLEALFVLALTTGMRQSELLGLKWEDVDLANGTLRVRRALQRVPGQGFVETEPKSATSRRQIALTPLGLAALKNHRAPQNEPAAALVLAAAGAGRAAAHPLSRLATQHCVAAGQPERAREDHPGGDGAQSDQRDDGHLRAHHARDAGRRDEQAERPDVGPAIRAAGVWLPDWLPGSKRLRRSMQVERRILTSYRQLLR
jgi:integrase